MLKSEFVEIISEKTGLTKRDVIAAVDAYNDTVVEALKRGDSIAFKGFGTYAVSFRKERKGRNPRTGETIHIPSSVIPKFSPAKAVRDAINEKNYKERSC